MTTVKAADYLDSYLSGEPIELTDQDFGIKEGDLLPDNVGAEEFLDERVGPPPETDFFGGLGLIGEALMEAPGQIKGSMAASARAGRNVMDENHYKRWVDEASAAAEEFARKGEAEDKNKMFVSSPLVDISYKDIREFPKNLGFSLTNMLVGLGVGVPLGLVPVPGSKKLAVGAGTLASGGVAYRMAKDNFTVELQEFLNEQSKENRGRDMTKKEWSDIVKGYDDAIKTTGIKLEANERKQITVAVSWRNPDAEKVIKKIHESLIK